MSHFDAFCVVSFGGPEGMADVMPFLDHVLKGRRVPHERKLEVAHHYEMFNGVSPINAQNRELIALLEERFAQEKIALPIFFGNRNWKPFIEDTVREMKERGHKRVLAYVTSAYDSYSGGRQYNENLGAARKKIGRGAPAIFRLPFFYNHPKFIQNNVERIHETLQRHGWNDFWHLSFCAHSVPLGQSQPYVDQLKYVCAEISKYFPAIESSLVFQSRSGPPGSPWLEPDICDHLRDLASKSIRQVLVAPIGFLSDHMEVKYDLDVEAKSVANELGIEMARAPTVGNSEKFVDLVVELVKEKIRN